MDIIINKYEYKLNGKDSIDFHSGCNFFRDKDDKICMKPKKHIDKMIGGYKKMFGENPSKPHKSPLDKEDLQEIDNYDLLGIKVIQQYQSIIGSIQWIVSLRRVEITTSVVSLPGYRYIPREGHFECANHIIGYLENMKHRILRCCTNMTSYSDLSSVQYNTEYIWQYQRSNFT